MSRVLLIVGGGIAAYKASELVRLLRKRGHGVRCVMTHSAARFVTPMTLAALSEDKVYTDLWDLKDEAEMGHIQLSRQADLVVVAPATADLLAKMAAGIADDLATTLLLATDKPVLAAPAMNVRMWDHAATRRNVATLIADGVAMIGPVEGSMACGEFGFGRFVEPDAIADAIEARLRGAQDRTLAGHHAIVTAGPTQEPIDPVRFIGNRSSGKQGFAVAAALAARGARVTLIAGPVALPTPAGSDRIDVRTADEMAAAVEAALPADIAVLVAAVADWRTDPAAAKIKKTGAPPTLTLIENIDILATLARGARRPKLLVGFAAETENVLANAQAKLARKGCDLLVANDVSQGVFGSDGNTVHILDGERVQSLPHASKDAVARALVDRIVRQVANWHD